MGFLFYEMVASQYDLVIFTACQGICWNSIWAQAKMCVKTSRNSLLKVWWITCFSCMVSKIMPQHSQRQVDSNRHTSRLFIAASQWTTWLQWGLCHLCYSASTVTITTYSDTKCKVQLPSKSLPIIKGSWVAVLPPLQLLSDYWVWGELRRQSAAKRRGPGGLGEKSNPKHCKK